MAAGLLQVPEQMVAAAEPIRPSAVKPVPTVPVTPVKVAKPPATSTRKQARDKPAPVWPSAGMTTLDVGSAGSGTLAKPGGLPVRVSAAKAETGRQAGPAPRRVQVSVLDRPTTNRSGVKGVLLKVAAADSTAGRLTVSVDYTAFATAYGADWSSRLRLVSLPTCALTTPGEKQCAAKPLQSRNDLGVRTVSADVPVSATAALLAVTAGASGPAGDYGATPLSASSTWSAGGNSGAFTWSYPMRVPPAPGGLTPELSLDYSSQSVDGRHAATNNQPSWMGEGFEAWPGGFIERRYRACAKDMDGNANNDEETGDLCWETDNAVLSLSGHSGELIYNSTEQRWHLRADDGTRIERKTGANNGDDNGEHWVVTTPGGVQYWFGLNRLPGWTADKPETNSTWNAPVFGNDPGEPCRATAFADSDCTQAWRWNLDYVVDLNGNSISYWYGKETNKYGRNLDVDDAASYDRGGWLDRIDYGTRRVNGADSIFSTPAPLRVDLDEENRCLDNCANHGEEYWPDTPWDSECTAAPCTDNTSITFWLTKRLSSITTQVRNGSSYTNVERWTFTHSFPDPGDGTRAGLWLEKISHTGLVGTTTSVPDIEFEEVQLANRVDPMAFGEAAMNWLRIARIDNETGGSISVDYSKQDCKADEPRPTPASNNRLCYPVIWEPEGYPQPVTDWFNKYVVETIYEADNTGGVDPQGSPRIKYSYSYLDGVAWHYNDDDGIIDKKAKTWSDYRGYGKVGVTVGDSGEQIYTETRYFRGMHGDRATTSGGTRTVTIDGIADEDWYAGMTRETKTLNGAGGPVVSRETNDPWASAATASRTINGDTVTSRYTRVATVRSFTTLDAGRGERETRVTTTYDPYGMAVKVDDLGDDDVTGDEQCTTVDYTPRNDAIWLMDRAHRVQTYALPCGSTNGTLTEADVIGETRTSYDGNAFETAPTRGLTTRTEEMGDWNSGSPTFVTTSQLAYDVHGRITSSRDAMNYETKTAYTPTTGGPVTGSTVTNPLLHTTTMTLSPAWGSVISSVDANGKRTDLAYDGLGRITAVWLPGRDKATMSANLTNSYLLRTDASTVVTTSRLNAAGAYVTGYAHYDGLLRPRQTQSPSPSGGRLLTEVFYDTAGRERKMFGAYHVTGGPGTTLETATDKELVPIQSRTMYDGAGRVTASVFQPYDVERWRTSTYYAGDRVDSTPPSGGTATSTVSDARGRVTQFRQYHGSQPTPGTAGSWDTTTYTYDRKGQRTAITDAAGNEWTWTYDIRGRKIETSDPDSGTTVLTYDNGGRVTTTTDARGKKLAYLYDPLNRKRAAYDNQVGAGGTLRAQWIYDTLDKGHLTQSTRVLPGGASYQVKVTGYTDTYQPEGTQYVIPTSETGLGGTYNYTNTWNPDDSLASVALPSAGLDLPDETLLYEYDALGAPTKLKTLVGNVNSSYVSGTLYNALGQVQQYDLHTGSGGKVWRAFSRELETGRLTGASTNRDSVTPNVVSDIRYTFDPAGNITRIKDVAPDPVDDTQCFDYDHLRRLTKAWTPSSGNCDAAPSVTGLGGPAPYWHSWTFDTVGNRTTQSVHTTTGTATTNYHYPTAGADHPHALTSTSGAKVGTYTYDLAGNTLTRPTPAAGNQTLTWDAEGELNTVTDSTGQTRYINDADGNRLIRRDATGSTLYLPGLEIRYTTATAAKTCTRYYSHLGSTVASRTSSGLTWLADDHQGTQHTAINQLTQAHTTRRQTPYGEPRGTVPTWPNAKGFVGGDNEPTDLTRLGARHYDAGIGRFVSVDPIQDLQQPQQWQGYAYANNNPITFSDPSGLYAIGDNEGHIRDYSPSKGKHKIVNYTPKVKKTTKNRPNTVIVKTEYYTVSVSSEGVVFLNTYPIPPGMSGAELATKMEEWCSSDGCESTFKCSVQACDLAGYDLEANGALSGLCDNGNCSESYRVTVRDDRWLMAVEMVGMFEVSGLVPGRMRSGSGGKTAYRAHLAACRTGSNSFPSGTLVLMADGSTKPIQEIRVGDTVLATDPENGQTAARVVTDLVVGDGSKRLVEITIVGKGSAAAAAKIVATDGHPFWSQSLGGWVEAEDLRYGDKLRTPAGAYLQVIALRSWSQPQRVHNLTVADLHTYYVLAGEVPVLVHNSDCPNGKLSDPLPRGMNNKIALAYDDVKAGRIASHDTYLGREHPWWAGAKEYRVPGRPDSDRILEKELPNGVKVYGWTSTHYKKIQRFSAPHFPDSGWN
ncbi:polymorphic toxin-type HINT domain-containing protein [Micromonospora echinospora]|uniref:polymorphic toxin-type HINT domain-containing protein n=1 Tax=Micromonospora echinospora TaxID=1877 RepID=UPI003A8C006C